MAVDARSSTPVGQVPVVLHPLWLSSFSLGTCAFFRLTHSLSYFLTGLRLVMCVDICRYGAAGSNGVTLPKGPPY